MSDGDLILFRERPKEITARRYTIDYAHDLPEITLRIWWSTAKREIITTRDVSVKGGDWIVGPNLNGEYYAMDDMVRKIMFIRLTNMGDIDVADENLIRRQGVTRNWA